MGKATMREKQSATSRPDTASPDGVILRRGTDSGQSEGMHGEMAEIGLGAPVQKDGRAVPARLAAFDRIVPLRGDDVLDYGCGNGIYTVRIAERFHHTAGVEVEENRLEEAKRLAEERGAAIDFRLAQDTLPFRDASFDCVTMIEVLEHVSDERASLAEIRRVLRPDGRLYVSVPNRLFPIETHSVLWRGKWINGKRLPGLPWIPPIHRRTASARTYTTRSLRSLLISEGFSMSNPEFIMPPFDNWQAGERWIRPLCERLEHGPLRRFGVSMLVVARSITH